jgi:hypothetical protein
MLRRQIALLALAAALPLAPRAQDREWEEDYSGQDAPAYEQPAEQPSDNYDVSVDLNDSGSVNLDTFQGSLAPYGEWVNTGNYGTVWRPRVAQGWRPYYYGRWEWTNEGWLWVSDEPFGWATYHYGRWTYDGNYGWVWVPGYQWAPAWVAWRTSGDVIGWAPLGPGLSVYVSTYPFVDYWWTFVPTARFCSLPIYTVAYAPGYSRRYFYETAPAPARPSVRPAPGRVLAPAPAWGGPAPRLVEQRMGRALTPVRVVAAPSPGAARVRPGEVAIFRPGARAATAPGYRGGGRGPGPAPAPGGVYPPARGNGRGPGAVPAPGNGGAYPPSRGNGRGPGAAPAPGTGGYHPPSRGGGPVLAPGRSEGGFVPAPRGGVRGPAMAPPAQSRGSYAPQSAPSRGGYAPPPAQSRGGYAPQPAPSRGAASPAPAQRGGGSGGGGGGGRPAPARGERERR